VVKRLSVTAERFTIAYLRDKFEEKGVMYVRNYSDLDIPWQIVFQTEKREGVEAYCNQHELAFEWLEGNTLRTTQVNPATAVHPVTGEKIWFNQAHLFQALRGSVWMQSCVFG
jgi:hypothetical protein